MSLSISYSEYVALVGARGSKFHLEDAAGVFCECGVVSMADCRSCGEPVCSEDALTCEQCTQDDSSTFYCAKCTRITQDLMFCMRHATEFEEETAALELSREQ